MPRYIDADKVLQYPLRRDRCDKEHANPHFINGVESVMEYIECLLEEEPADMQEVKHGMWEYDEEASIPHIKRIYRCSVCRKGEAWVKQLRAFIRCEHLKDKARKQAAHK